MDIWGGLFISEKHFRYIWSAMRFLITISILLASALNVSAQNQLDDQGRKSGRWIVDHPNGRSLYEADFFEGRPVGEMIRYYENGVIRARMVFDSSGVRSYTRMFFQSGDEAARGWYVNQQKDSVWTYFSPVDGSIRIREPYEVGKLHGIVRKYYSNGQVLSLIHISEPTRLNSTSRMPSSD